MGSPTNVAAKTLKYAQFTKHRSEVIIKDKSVKNKS
jgi:hypothetical protein